MWRILERARKGDATHSDINLLDDVTKQIEGHTICAFGEGSVWPVQAYSDILEKKSIRDAVMIL